MTDHEDKPGRLVLGRKPGEAVLLYPPDGGPPLTVELLLARNGYGRLAIMAPKDWRIERVAIVGEAE